jgi:hypothetical protein
MKYSQLLSFVSFIFLLVNISAKSQDYARHIELSLLFYECQRSGPLPKTNRIYWRHDSMLDAGADNGVDLTGGYYDAGDNVKFNFPQAFTITMLAWSGITFADGYKKTGQMDYLLDAVKWGTDYFIKCHTGKDELYVQVGSGQTDHTYWTPPEYITYEYPSYKITASAPGSEVAAETAAALAAASVLFKDVDSLYSATLLKHSEEIYDFADKNRGDYTKAVPAQDFYGTFSGYNDELAWGAAWLYRATGEEAYHEKFKKIADASYESWDTKKYPGCTGPITWDDKRPGCYALIAELTGDEARLKTATEYCDAILKTSKTKGGLYYVTNLSQWASNRYAANAASMVAIVANMLPETDSKRKEYIDFVKSQIDYILGDNPAGVNYVVGAEENSPKAVHHRAASAVFDPRLAMRPKENIFTLYGALAGGPGMSDDYVDDRNNFQMNEVALDYNAGFTMCLAGLVHFGLGVKDTGEILEFDRAWPPKDPTPDVTIEMTNSGMSVSTGSGMVCSSWCVSFTLNVKIEAIFGCTPYLEDFPNYIVCNARDTHYLDGDGTAQSANFIINDKNFEPPSEYEFLCDGFHAADNQGVPIYKPEFGKKYKVTGKGGPSNTVPL